MCQVEIHNVPAAWDHRSVAALLRGVARAATTIAMGRAADGLTPSLTVCTYSRESFFISSSIKRKRLCFFLFFELFFHAAHLFWIKRKTRYTRCQANRLAALFFAPLIPRPSTGVWSTHTRHLSAFPSCQQADRRS
jgi:hypothetical protein